MKKRLNVIVLLICVSSLFSLFSCKQNKTSFDAQSNFEPPANIKTGNKDVLPPYSSNPEELSLDFYLGVAYSGNACGKIPQIIAKISTKLIPYAYCVTGNSLTKSDNKLQFFITTDSSKVEAQRTDSWVDENKLEKLVVLRNGLNFYRLFVRDNRGNWARADRTITLDMGNPPQIDLISPSAVALSQDVWSAGQTKTIKIKVTDNDTLPKDIKVIYALNNPNGTGQYHPLACNFRNAGAWKQCPEGAEQSSTSIVLNQATSEFTYTFQLPANFDYNTPFVFAVTAIDQSGNAAVMSTPELNAGYEVIAGRTYKGGGGSGVTIQSVDFHNTLAADKNGVIYIPNLASKVHSFDSRICRAYKTISQPNSFADCIDIVAGDFSIDSNWHYNPHKDVFYLMGTKSNRRFLLELDFNEKVVRQLSGDHLKPKISRAELENNDEIANYYAIDVNSFMYYDANQKLLFFKIGSQIFSLDENNKIQFRFGKQDSGKYPIDQLDADPSEVEIPSGNHFFASTKDGVFIFEGEKYPETRNGSGFGLQYALFGFDANNPNKKLGSIKLSQQNSEASHSTNWALNGITYDSSSNTIYASLKWIGVYSLKIPTENRHLKESYVWNVVLGGSGPKTSIDVYLEDEVATTSVSLPRNFKFHSGRVLYAGSGLLLFVDYQLGYVASLDLSSGRTARVLGYAMGRDEDQFAINRRLDTPRFLLNDEQGRLLFGDYYRLNRVTFYQEGNPTIESLYDNFPGNPFVLHNNKLYQQDRWHLIEYDYSQKPMILKSNGYPNSIASNYEMMNTMGFRNNKFSMFAWTSMWNGYEVGHSYLVQRSVPFPLSFNAANKLNINFNNIISRPDRVSLNHSGINKAECDNLNCAQGVMNGNNIATNTLRMSATSSHYYWRNAISHPVFDPTTDDRVFTCLNRPDNNLASFALLTPSNVQFIEIFNNGTKLTCGQNSTVFAVKGSDIYFGGPAGIFKVNAQNLDANTYQYSATKVNVVGKLAHAVRYSGLLITDTHVIYSEPASHRVIRNKLE